MSYLCILGQRLHSEVHKRLNATSEFDCGAHCYHDSCCRSANFRKIHSKDEQGNCELLHAVEWEKRGKVQKNHTYDYLIMLQPQRVSIIWKRACQGTST